MWVLLCRWVISHKSIKSGKANQQRIFPILTFVIFSVGTLTWLVYGILLKDFTIIFGFVIGVIGSWSVLLLSLKYKNKKE